LIDSHVAATLELNFSHTVPVVRYLNKLKHNVSLKIVAKPDFEISYVYKKKMLLIRFTIWLHVSLILEL